MSFRNRVTNAPADRFVRRASLASAIISGVSIKSRPLCVLIAMRIARSTTCVGSMMSL